ncbi:membrane progestin receptor alpha-like [Ostrea edulis]|uniref:membrane progestin receptor alpha-like n=1 Tax=Ostrea edulis TaxID=37623 RepID=UPI0024AFD069|nr:membrane progestin receptor alpha-like [Ostrea edulis]XP_056005745.1 membrane progestin receptor alpha-like [Ostrea edulis]
MALYKKTLDKSQVPTYFHVPFIETGYRYLHQPWRFYLYSVFYNNMETLNVWTHVVGTLVMTSRLYKVSVTFDLCDLYTWPLLTSLLSFFATYLASSFAHMFSHKSKEVNCCIFMVDFAFIGLFGFGAVLNHYHYSVHVDITSQQQVLFTGSVLAIFCCVCGAVSKAVIHDPHSKHRSILTATGIGLLYVLSIIPIVNRILSSETTEGIYHHSKQIFNMVASGFFFSSRLPERLFPGKFDFFGNSHQVFHLLMIQASDSHVDGIIWDMLFRKLFRLPRVTASFWSTFGLIAIIAMADVFIMHRFYLTFKDRLVHQRSIPHVNNNTIFEKVTRHYPSSRDNSTE